MATQTYKYLGKEEQQMVIQSRVQQAERQLFDATVNRDIESAAINAGPGDDTSKKGQTDNLDLYVIQAKARLTAAQALDTSTDK